MSGTFDDNWGYLAHWDSWFSWARSAFGGSTPPRSKGYGYSGFCFLLFSLFSPCFAFISSSFFLILLAYYYYYYYYFPPFILLAQHRFMGAVVFVDFMFCSHVWEDCIFMCLLFEKPTKICCRCFALFVAYPLVVRFVVLLIPCVLPLLIMSWCFVEVSLPWWPCLTLDSFYVWWKWFPIALICFFMASCSPECAFGRCVGNCRVGISVSGRSFAYVCFSFFLWKMVLLVPWYNQFASFLSFRFLSTLMAYRGGNMGRFPTPTCEKAFSWPGYTERLFYFWDSHLFSAREKRCLALLLWLACWFIAHGFACLVLIALHRSFPLRCF